MTDQELLFTISSAIGRVEASVGIMREDINQNTSDIASIKQDIATAKGASRVVKWALGLGLTIIGFFVGSTSV